MITEHFWFETWKKSNPNSNWRDFKEDQQKQSLSKILDLGGTLMALANFSKTPFKGSHGVDDTPLTPAETWEHIRKGRNIAVRIGCEQNKFNQEVVIVDFEGDLSSHRVFWEERPLWMEHLASKTMSVMTPSNGFHCYCSTKDLSSHDKKDLLSILKVKMSKYQNSLPVVVTYALIPYSRIHVRRDLILYFWNNEEDPMPFGDFVEMIP